MVWVISGALEIARRLRALELRQIELAIARALPPRRFKPRRSVSEPFSIYVMQRPELVQGDLNPWCRSSGQTITLTENGQRDDPKRDSLIRLENSLIRRFNSLLHPQKFPVPMRREFPHKSLDLLPYLASFGCLARPKRSKFPVFSQLAGNLGNFRDEFARDSPLQPRVMQTFGPARAT